MAGNATTNHDRVKSGFKAMQICYFKSRLFSVKFDFGGDGQLIATITHLDWQSVPCYFALEGGESWGNGQG